MKYLLNICGVGFIAKDSTQAAKVADLLGHMQPCSREWLSTGGVLVKGRSRHDDDVTICELGERKPMERKAFEALKKKEREEQLKSEAALEAEKDGGAK